MSFRITAMNAEMTVDGWIGKRFADYPNLAVKLLYLNDKFWSAVQLPGDKYRSARAFFRNVKNQSNVLRTQHVKFGQYSDLVEMIPDAMLTAVIDFVEQECAHMTRWCFDSDPKIKSMTNAELGIMWLTRDETGESPWKTEVLEIYDYAKNRWRTRDAYEESGANAYWDSGDDGSVQAMIDKINKNRDEWAPISEKLHRIEQEIIDEETEMLIRIVKIRRHLWT